MSGEYLGLRTVSSSSDDTFLSVAGAVWLPAYSQLVPSPDACLATRNVWNTPDPWAPLPPHHLFLLLPLLLSFPDIFIFVI